jgi:hypothetical protein
MGDDVVHRKDSLRYAFVVHDWQAPHLSACHGVQSFMNFVIRLAPEDISCGDFSDGQFSRQPVSRSHGDADIPVRDESKELLIDSDDR